MLGRGGRSRTASLASISRSGCNPPNQKRRPGGGRRFHLRWWRGSEAQTSVLVLELRHAPARIHELGAAAGPGRMRQRVDVERERLTLIAPGGLHLHFGAVGHADG